MLLYRTIWTHTRFWPIDARREPTVSCGLSDKYVTTRPENQAWYFLIRSLITTDIISVESKYHVFLRNVCLDSGIHSETPTKKQAKSVQNLSESEVHFEIWHLLPGNPHIKLTVHKCITYCTCWWLQIFPEAQLTWTCFKHCIKFGNYVKMNQLLLVTPLRCLEMSRKKNPNGTA
jgi:hypothetical protein